MLVFARDVDDRIVIGHDIEVCLVDIEAANKVRIGVEAPKEIQVFRKEVITERDHSTFVDVKKRQAFYVALVAKAVAISNSRSCDLATHISAITQLLAEAGYLKV